MNLYQFFFTSSILTAVVFLAGSGLSKKLHMDEDKAAPFECGFTPKFKARLPFSMRFFLIAIVFLVFDVELVLLFPFIVGCGSSNVQFTLLGVITFLIILTVGLAHEWNQGSLDWAH